MSRSSTHTVWGGLLAAWLLCGATGCVVSPLNEQELSSIHDPVSIVGATLSHKHIHVFAHDWFNYPNLYHERAPAWINIGETESTTGPVITAHGMQWHLFGHEVAAGELSSGPFWIPTGDGRMMAKLLVVQYNQPFDYNDPGLECYSFDSWVFEPNRPLPEFWYDRGSGGFEITLYAPEP